MAVNETDNRLLRRWADQRDAEAFTEIVRRHGGLVLGTCRRILGNAAEAEDAAQECFMALAASRQPVVRSLSAWLHRSAVNRSLDRLKSDKRRRARDAQYMAERPKVSEPQWRDIEALVDEAVDRLPVDLRVPILLHFIEGKSHENIAALIGLSKSGVTRRIQRGVGAVRETLKTRGVAVPAAFLSTALSSHMASAASPALTASLGKVALAGHAAVEPAKAAVIGGTFAMKAQTVVAGAIVVAAVVGAALYVGTRNSEGPSAFEAAEIAAEPSPTTGDIDSQEEGAALDVRPLQPETEETFFVVEPVAAPAAGFASVSGRVIHFAAAAPVPNASLRLIGPLGTETRMVARVTESGADGVFQFPEVEPGDYTLTPTHDRYVPGPDLTKISLTQGQELRSVRVTMYDGGIVEGVVSLNGSPLTGHDVQIVYPYRQGRRTTTDDDGRYRFDAVLAGPLTVLTAKELSGVDTEVAKQAESAYGAVTTVDLEFVTANGGVEGWVLIDGAPKREVEGVWAIPKDGDPLSGRRFAATDHEGYYSISGLAEGDYLLAPIRPPSYARDIAPIIEQKCVSCHQPAALGGSVPYPELEFTDYRQVRAWSVAMVEVVSTQSVHGDMVGEGVLTQFEADTIVHWRDSGAPSGSRDSDDYRFEPMTAAVSSNATTRLDFTYP